ncbi:hypothetical protein HanRHA438_Chr11g0522971 [Helianthus annuus]|nr:hypothetical protein HanRHA438_Chr11g0522971 [Helianthus annuus]
MRKFEFCASVILNGPSYALYDINAFYVFTITVIFSLFAFFCGSSFIKIKPPFFLH